MGHRRFLEKKPKIALEDPLKIYRICHEKPQIVPEDFSKIPTEASKMAQ